jgi:hypothetical protein
VTLEDAELAYREQWGPLGELALRSLREFTTGDQTKIIALVRRSLAAPREVFVAFYQSAMRDAVARGLLPQGAGAWIDEASTTSQEAN